MYRLDRFACLLIVGLFVVPLSGQADNPQPEYLGYEHESNVLRGKVLAQLERDQEIVLPNTPHVSRAPSPVEEMNRHLVNEDTALFPHEKVHYTKAVHVDPNYITTLAETAFYAYEDKMGKKIEGLDPEYETLRQQGWTMYPFQVKFGFGEKNAIQMHGGFVYVKGNEIIVSYRGSGNPKDMPDHWTTNGRISNSEEKLGFSGNLHEGFYKAAESSFTQIEGLMAIIYKSTGKSASDFVYRFTGHSLGGAQAQIAAAHFKKLLGLQGTTGQLTVFTFGAPGWADEAVAKQYDEFIGKENLVRFEETFDVVPHSTDLFFVKVGTLVKVSPYKSIMDSVTKEAISVVTNPTFYYTAYVVALKNPLAGLVTLGVEWLGGFGWGLWNVVKGAPVNSHNMSNYAVNARGAMENYVQDPEQVGTLERWGNAVGNFFSPVTNFFKPVVTPVVNAIGSGLQTVVKYAAMAADWVQDNVPQSVKDAGKVVVKKVATAFWNTVTSWWGKPGVVAI